jgi:glycosyltransferase involved in cell wall biosynthesis
MIFLKNEKIKYFAHYDKILGIGIENKINGFILSAQSNGWIISKKAFHKKGIFEHLKMGYDILTCEERNILLRSTAHSLIFIYPFCYISSFKKNIILEVPTPHVTSFFELINIHKFNPVNLIKSFLLVFLGPFTFLPFKKIIQYSEEGLWWSLFCKKKILLTTNGIDLRKVPIRTYQPNSFDTINLIGVANLSFWHGYDRVIKAIDYLINNKKINYKINFFVIGEGDELENLKSLVYKYQLLNYVIFVPFKNTNDLNYYFSESHLAVGSLGLHRKNLKIASELKAREYVAFGIPFIATGIDLDFQKSNNFRYEISLDENYTCIANLIEEIHKGKLILPNRFIIREYAVENLDMDIKVNNILSL